LPDGRGIEAVGGVRRNRAKFFHELADELEGVR